MGCRGLTGEIVEVRRSDGELCIEWRIPRFLSLYSGFYDYYDSPRFSFWEGRWFMRVWPNSNLSGQSALYLFRDDKVASTKTVNVTVGVRGSGGVEMRSEGDRQISNRSYWGFNKFCMRSELSEQKHTLMPEDALVIWCELTIPGTARGAASSYQDTSVQTDYDNRTCTCQSLDKQDVATETDDDLNETLTDGKQSSGKKAAFGDDGEEKNSENNDDKNDKGSRNGKNLKKQVKNTKKISLPARHGSVIRSLKSILAEGSRADFTLKSGGREWPVHRAILEGRSGHFEALFRGEWTKKDKARIDDVAEGVLDGVLHFIYAGEVGDVSVENVCGIYVAAHKLLLEDLKSLCVEYMKEKMCPELVCVALAIAEECGEGDLKESALECFFQESSRIVATEGWKNLKENHPAIIGELFQEFIKRERKNRRKEQD